MADQKLADLLQEQHSDPWLQDFLKALKPGDNAGLVALRQAIDANKQQLGDEARKHANLATAFFHKTHNTAGELRAHYQEVYAFQRELDGRRCLDYVAAMEPALRLSNYHELMARLLQDKAVCEKRAGRPGDIQRSIDESLKITHDYHYGSTQSRLLGLAAGFSKEARDCKRAWEKVRQGLEFYWQAGYSPARLYQFVAVATDCAEFQKQWHSAEALRRYSIDIHGQMDRGRAPNNVGLGMLYLDLANILAAEKREEAATASAATADRILKDQILRPQVKKFRATLLLRLVQLRLENGNPELAYSTLKPIMDFANSTGDEGISLSCNGLLGEIYLAQAKYAEADKVFRVEIVRSERSLTTLKSSEDRLAWLATTDRIYRGLTETWLKQNRTQEAWRLWEWYKGRSLAVKTGKSLSFAMRDWAAIERALAEPLEANDSAESRVVYAVFSDGVQIWFTQRGPMNSHWVPISKTALAAKVQEFYEYCSSPATPMALIKLSGSDLFAKIWQPVATDVAGSETVIVELDGPLQNLVVEALTAPDNQYLLAKHQIVYSPGARMDGVLRKPRIIGPKSRMLLLDATASSGESPIPSQVREVKFIANQFSNSTIEDGAVTSVDKMNHGIRQNQLFFFAGHGVKIGDETRLLVNPELMINATDFSSESLTQLQLVIFAACSTGSTDENGLLNTHTLDNSILSAGVPAVISSRWDVESDSTADLMQGFFTALARSGYPSSAIYQAQKEVMADQDLPYYWAGFYLAGRAN